jgi:trimeric autotransporter adhesin
MGMEFSTGGPPAATLIGLAFTGGRSVGTFSDGRIADLGPSQIFDATTLNTSIANLQSNLTAVQGSVAAAQTAISALQAAKTTDEAAAATVASAVAALTTRVTADEGTIASIQTLVAALQAARGTDEANIAALQVQAASLIASRTSDESAIAAAQAAIAALRTSQTSDEAAIAANASAIAALRTSQTADEATLTAANAAIAAIQSRLSADEALITALQTRATTDEAAIAANGASITALLTSGPQGVVRGRRAFASPASGLAAFAYAAVGDQLTIQGSGAAVTYAVAANDTLATLIAAVNAQTAARKVQAALDAQGYLLLQTTDATPLTVTGTSSLVWGVLGLVDNGQALYSLSPAATETDIRAKVALAYELANSTSKPVVVELPAAKVAFTSPLVLADRKADNVYLRGKATTRNNLVSIGAVAAVAGSTYQFDVALTLDSVAGVTVGGKLWLQYLGMNQGQYTGNAAWTALCGNWPVQSISGNVVTVRITSRNTGGPVTNLQGIAVSASTAGSNAYPSFAAVVVHCPHRHHSRRDQARRVEHRWRVEHGDPRGRRLHDHRLEGAAQGRRPRRDRIRRERRLHLGRRPPVPARDLRGHVLRRRGVAERRLQREQQRGRLPLRYLARDVLRRAGRRHGRLAPAHRDVRQRPERLPSRDRHRLAPSRQGPGFGLQHQQRPCGLPRNELVRIHAGLHDPGQHGRKQPPMLRVRAGVLQQYGRAPLNRHVPGCRHRRQHQLALQLRIRR